MLRQPLGLVLGDKDTEGEEKQVHIAALQDGVVVGTVLFKFLSPERVKIRQMGVSPLLQGKGIGRKLMQFAEAVVQGIGIREVELNARIYAKSFYEKLGYRPVGEEFLKMNVPHTKMEKYF